MATSPTGFKFSVDPKKLRRPEPFPQAIYKLRLTNFYPKNAKIKQGETVSESTNFNPEFTMIAPGEDYDQRVMRYLFVGNSKNEQWLQDMVHACGLVMEGDIMDDTKRPSMPGIWDADKHKFDPKDASTWVYQGPMLNQELEAELSIEPDQNGIPQNKILRFVCRVPDCEIKYPKINHSKAMRYTSSKR